MPPFSKQKRKSKDQPHTKNGQYYTKRTQYTSMDDHNLPDTSMSVNDNCVNVKDFQTKISGAVTAAHENGDSGNEYIDLDFEFLNEEWGDDEDSDGNDTNDFTELKETKLVWKEDNQFEK
ncbi:5310_t:CDS:1 [Funneliformis geosporum]|uniref:5310_t:CDS:1 n=1 Tax=Funneliformis geosporum TaxID=1117311 RepID=A0A9W4WR74_9GLOM|nr:5310_t:CDS:1 [Funneliformis geosporum]